MTNYRRKQMALCSLPQPLQSTLASGKMACTWSQVFFDLSLVFALLVLASAVLS
jgi:hypothetical protein